MKAREILEAVYTDGMIHGTKSTVKPNYKNSTEPLTQLKSLVSEKELYLDIANDTRLMDDFYKYQEGIMSRRKLCENIAQAISKRLEEVFK